MNITLYCGCGHEATLGPDDFKKWPGLSLHRVIEKTSCMACAVIGDVRDILVTPIRTGGFRERES